MATIEQLREQYNQAIDNLEAARDDYDDTRVACYLLYHDNDAHICDAYHRQTCREHIRAVQAAEAELRRIETELMCALQAYYAPGGGPSP